MLIPGTIQISGYHPDPAKCCERCCFGTGDHAPFCEKRQTAPESECYGDDDWR